MMRIQTPEFSHEGGKIFVNTQIFPSLRPEFRPYCSPECYFRKGRFPYFVKISNCYIQPKGSFNNARAGFRVTKKPSNTMTHEKLDVPESFAHCRQAIVEHW